MSLTGDHHTLDDIYGRIGSVQSEVHKLAMTKQDKVKPALVLSFLLFLFAQTVTAVWWASEVTNGVNTVVRDVAALGTDRFYGKDGVQMQRLWEIETATLKSELADMRSQIHEMKDKQSNTASTISAITSVQGECQRRLKNVE